MLLTLLSLKRTEMPPLCPRSMSILPKSGIMDKNSLHFLIHRTVRHVNIIGPQRASNREPKSFLIIMEFIWERVDLVFKLLSMKTLREICNYPKIAYHHHTTYDVHLQQTACQNRSQPHGDPKWFVLALCYG